MPIAQRWAGRAFGTNTGNLFVRIEGADDQISGDLRLNDPEFGVTVYSISGKFDGEILSIEGKPEDHGAASNLGLLQAKAKITPNGELRGDWSTTIGTAGTFVLHPHGSLDASPPNVIELPQLYTARHLLGAVVLDRSDIISLAEDLKKNFFEVQPIVTIITNTEQSMFLEHFKAKEFKNPSAKFLKIFIQEAEGNGINRVISVEFGQQNNVIMTQSSDESWVLGRLEALKGDLRGFERFYATRFQKFGVTLYQLIILISIVYSSSFSEFYYRMIFILSILLVVALAQALQNKYIPFSTIYVGERAVGGFRKLVPTLLSWLLAATAGVFATLLANYLQNWINQLGVN